MKRSYQIIDIHGDDSSKWKHEFHHVECLYEYVDPEDNSKNLHVYKCYKYTPDELEENTYYGDIEFEEYLMSDLYEDDCKREQWDWIKNEG